MHHHLRAFVSDVAFDISLGYGPFGKQCGRLYKLVSHPKTITSLFLCEDFSGTSVLSAFLNSESVFNHQFSMTTQHLR